MKTIASKHLPHFGLVRALILQVVFFLGCSSLQHDSENKTGRVPNSKNLYSEAEAITVIAQFMNWQDRVHQDSWPTLQFSRTPTLIHLSNGHTYAFDLGSQDPRWTKKVLDGRQVLYSQSDFLGISGITISPAFPIEGKLAFVYKLDFKGEIYGRIFINFLHERFHAHQFTHFEGMAEKKGLKYFGHTDEDNVALIAIENLILKQWMNKPSIDSIKDYLAVNGVRLRLLKPESKAWENRQQRMEGLADYFSWKITEKSKIVDSIDLAESKQTDVEAYFSFMENGIDNVIKWRHYVVGALLGEALDLYGPKEWKALVENKNESMIEILRSFIRLNADEVGQRVAGIKQTHGFDALKTHIRTQIHFYLTQIKKYKKEFVALPGTELVVRLPKREGCSGGSLSNKSFYLANGGKLDLGSSGTYSCADMIRLEYKNIPILISESQPDLIRLKLGHGARISLDGRSLTVETLFRMARSKEFQKLNVVSPNFTLEGKDLPGKFEIDSSKLVLVFE